MADYEKAVPQELSVKSGDVVQLIREGEDGQWWASTHTHRPKDSLCNITQAWNCVAINSCFTLCRFVKNLRCSKEGWVPAANLLSLISESKSSQSLSSSGIFPIASLFILYFKSYWAYSLTHLWLCVCPADGSVSGNVSTSSSCSETYTSYSDIKPWPIITPAPLLDLPTDLETADQILPQTKALVSSLFLAVAVFTQSAVLCLKTVPT